MNTSKRYQCGACGHKFTKASSSGACPACASPLVRVLKGARAEPQEARKEKPTKTKIEIFTMTILWALLIYGVYDKYIAV